VTHGQTRHNSAHRVVHKLVRCALKKSEVKNAVVENRNKELIFFIQLNEQINN